MDNWSVPDRIPVKREQGISFSAVYGTDPDSGSCARFLHLPQAGRVAAGGESSVKEYVLWKRCFP